MMSHLALCAERLSGVDEVNPNARIRTCLYSQGDRTCTVSCAFVNALCEYNQMSTMKGLSIKHILEGRVSFKEHQRLVNGNTAFGALQPVGTVVSTLTSGILFLKQILHH
jgi:hypothetical protein